MTCRAATVRDRWTKVQLRDAFDIRSKISVGANFIEARGDILLRASNDNRRGYKRLSAETPMAKTGKPNILILWGDDIGIWNISHFSRGMMGYRTPNIDRVAEEGVTFTDYYSQQSCTAGRACFITGQNPDPHRPDQGRHARRHRRPSEGRPDHRRTAEAARLRHRPVRQEPPRRPGRIPADACTASTSSSATSIT